jgi:hypothetical protein
MTIKTISIAPVGAQACDLDQVIMHDYLEGGMIRTSACARSIVDGLVKKIGENERPVHLFFYQLKDWMDAKLEGKLLPQVPEIRDVLNLAYELCRETPNKTSVFIIPVEFTPEVEDENKKIISVPRYLAVLIERINGGAWHHTITTVQIKRVHIYLEDADRYNAYIVSTESNLSNIKTLLG